MNVEHWSSYEIERLDNFTFPFSVCVITGGATTLLDSYIRGSHQKNILFYSIINDGAVIEDWYLKNCHKYPNIALTTKTYPFSCSHLLLAPKILIAPDVNDEDIQEIIKELKLIKVKHTA